jgi:GntR family transcriptional regulator
MSRIPAYKVVYSSIKEDIKDKHYKPGDLLPTESELGQRYSISRTTIRRAIGLLSAEGYVQVIQGKGMVVQDTFTTQRLNYITSITETLAAKGHVVTTKSMQIERIKAPDYVGEALELNKGAYVFEVQRVQCANGVPIALMINYFKESAVPDLDKYAGKFTSLYAFLEKNYGAILKDATETIFAVSATFMEAQVLQIAAGSPLLCSRRVTSTEQGPLEYGIMKLVADKYEYSVYLTGRK